MNQALLLYEFGPFVLDTIQHALLKTGQPISLTPKTYDTLLFLVRNSGRMVGKEELMGTLWPDSFVEESNLTQQISMVRKALGDTAGEQKYVVTVPARGYRFSAEVKEVLADQPRPELFVVDVDHESLSAQATTLSTSDGPSDGQASDGHAKDLQNQTPASRFAPRGRMLLTLVALMLLAATGVLLSYLGYRKHIRPSDATKEQPRSLAILPFRNLKQDSASDFLGFSLADAVITKLGYVSALTVRPSSAVEKYRNQVIDISRVGAELNVDTLLTGNFIRDGDDLRITSQLIGVRNRNILWKGSFDFKYDKLLTVQDNVTLQIVKELALRLSTGEAERLKADAPVHPLAYEYYLHAVDLYSRNDFSTAIRMLEKSAEIDPNYPLTWAHLGRAFQASASLQFGGREQYGKAEAAYLKALSLSPQQIEAHVFMANLFTDTGRVEQAVPLLREAFVTNPNYAELHWELGYAYRFGGALQQSVAECERARQLDPGVKRNSSTLNGYLYLGQYDKFLESLPNTNDVAFVVFYRGFGEYYKGNRIQAAQQFDRAFELDQSLLQAQVGRAMSYGIAKEPNRGLAMLREAEHKVNERGVREPEAIYKLAQAYLVLGDQQAALRTLRQSIENGFFAYPYLAIDPVLQALHGNREFGELLQLARTRHAAFEKKFF